MLRYPDTRHGSTQRIPEETLAQKEYVICQEWNAGCQGVVAEKV